MPRRFGLLTKHQLGAAAATSLDFAVMIALCELVRLSPVTGTALGAASGALANFWLARRWIFGAAGAPAGGQALRYLAVALGSLGLNSLGEHLALRFWTMGSSYITARVAVSGLVGVGWNYPLHRRFVFRKPTPSAEPLARAA